ncbi:MAG: hypothetical protein QXQ69_02715 [Candidatus Aenigmatarchaeota archaeon]
MKYPPWVDNLSTIWAVCVGIVKDSLGIRKLRIAKGKIRGKVFRDENGKINFELTDKKNPITQVNRLNIKSYEEWEKIKSLVEKWIKKLK